MLNRLKIKYRLALLFALLTGVLIVILELIIYFSLQQFGKQEFRTRLHEHGLSAADAYLSNNPIRDDSEANSSNDLGLVDEYFALYTDNMRLEYVNHKSVLPQFNDIKAYIPLDKETFLYNSNKPCVLTFPVTAQGKQWHVLVSATDVYTISKLSYLRQVMGLALLVYLVLIFLAGWYFAGQALAPISEMIKQVNAMTANSLSQRLKLRQNKNAKAQPSTHEMDELEQLAATFNSLLIRLEQAFEAQRYFVQNASHEFNTPLTRMMGRIELLLSKERPTFEYQNALDRMYQECEKLHELTKGLLLLAHLDGARTQKELVDINFPLLIEREIREITPRYPGCNISLQVLPPFDKLVIIRAIEALFVILVRNTIDNALKFSKSDIEVSLICETELWIYQVVDKGPGVSDLELSNLGTTMYRTESARTVKGSGLGLALCKKIVERHGGKIVWSHTAGGGLTVTCAFPKGSVWE